MTATSSSVPWRRLPAVSWLMVRAFTRNRVLAVLALPTALLSLVPYVARRVLHETPDRNGMVILGRYRPFTDAVLSIAFIVPLVLIAVPLALWVALTGPAGALLVLAVVIAGGAGAAALLVTSSLTAAVGAETPSGRRWALMALAQRPGTALSALLLTRRLVAAVPAGAVVVAVAADEDLAKDYVRLGFSRGRGLRIFKEF